MFITPRHVLDCHLCPVTTANQGPQLPGHPCQQAARGRGPRSKVPLGQVSAPRCTRSRTQRGGNLQTKGTLLMASATLPKPQIFCGENSQWVAAGAKTPRRHMRWEIGFGGWRGAGRTYRQENIFGGGKQTHRPSFPWNTGRAQGWAGSSVTLPVAVKLYKHLLNESV